MFVVSTQPSCMALQAFATRASGLRVYKPCLQTLVRFIGRDILLST